MNDSAHLAMANHFPDGGIQVPSVRDSAGTKLLPFVLSVTAGSVDIISFLGLGGLFTAHITGNIVVLAGKLVAGEQAPAAYLIAVPMFMVALALTKLLAAGLERIRVGSLLPLLSCNFCCFRPFSRFAGSPGLLIQTPRSWSSPACWASRQWPSKTRLYESPCGEPRQPR
jgi:hypothetical protein